MTQSDGTGQRSTLTSQQDAVLLGLLAGKTLTEAARDAGVSRQAASGWQNRDPVFQGELLTRQRERREGLCQRLELAGSQALTTILELLTAENAPKIRLDAAFRILEILGPKPRPPSLRRIAALRRRQEPFEETSSPATSALAAETEKVRGELLALIGGALAAKKASPSPPSANGQPAAGLQPAVSASR